MQEHEHLNNEALLHAAYGLADSKESGGAWRECAACRAAVEGMSSRRLLEGMAANAQLESSVPEWFWIRQREGVMSAVRGLPARPERFRRQAVVASVAMAAAMVAAVWTFLPAKGPVVQKHPQVQARAEVRASDERLLTEVSAEVNRVEPQALAPMDMLFSQ